MGSLLPPAAYRCGSNAFGSWPPFQFSLVRFDPCILMHLFWGSTAAKPSIPPPLHPPTHPLHSPPSYLGIFGVWRVCSHKQQSRADPVRSLALPPVSFLCVAADTLVVVDLGLTVWGSTGTQAGLFFALLHSPPGHVASVVYEDCALQTLNAAPTCSRTGAPPPRCQRCSHTTSRLCCVLVCKARHRWEGLMGNPCPSAPPPPPHQFHSLTLWCGLSVITKHPPLPPAHPPILHSSVPHRFFHCFRTTSGLCCASRSSACKARHRWEGVMGNPCPSASPSHHLPRPSHYQA